VDDPVLVAGQLLDLDAQGGQVLAGRGRHLARFLTVRL
jgi:hypothetical protein